MGNCSFRTLFILLIAPFLLAQQSIQYASLGGRVSDASGAPLEGAQITIRHLETNRATGTLTDSGGRFRFPYLASGAYELTVRRDGFSDAKRQLELSLGAAVELPVVLSVGPALTTVDVRADAAVLESARSQIAGTVARTEIEQMPLNGRNFLDAALLVPGVSPTNTASTQLFPETSAVAGQGLSINSQRNFSNSYIVDGLSANDDAAGLSGLSFGVDAIAEFQVVTSGGQAEFGRALGGYMSMVTRSGANTLHGTAYGFFRQKSLNAANPLSFTRLPFTQAQYGASLGGPVRKERSFYFANFEQRRLHQSGLVTISPANAAAINARLAATGYRGPLVTTGLYPNPVGTANLVAKVDHQIRRNDLLTVRYTLYDVASRNSRGAGALSALSAAAGLENTDHNIAVSNILTLSPRVVNETRGQFTSSGLAAEPNDAFGPAVSIAGIASFGRLSGSPTGRDNQLYELVDNLAVQAGAHAVRAGASFLYNGTAIRFPRAIGGSYAFSSLQNFLNGVYNNLGFTQTFGRGAVSLSNPNAGFYVQDEWKILPKLTLNAGLRYDLQFLERIRTDRNNVSPRAGFAYTPLASRRLVLRGSYGLFNDRVPLRALANALLSSNNTTSLTDLSQINVALSPAQTGAPRFPALLATAPSAVLVNFTTMASAMQNAYAEQGSVEAEQQLGARSTVSAGYQHVRGLRLIVTVNQNVPACVASGTNNGCRPNPNFANNTQYVPGADSRYDGFFASFVQRPVRWGSYRVSYTYSKSNNNVGEFFFSGPLNPFNIWQDWGRSDDDQRHRLMINAAANTNLARATTPWQWLTRGYRLTGTLQFYSALPFNITTGGTTIQGTAARPLVNGAFISRNSGAGFDRFSVNLRLAREFPIAERVRLEVLAEAFNATNRINGVTLNGTFGSGVFPASPAANFRQTTSVAEPRGGQLAVRLTF